MAFMNKKWTWGAQALSESVSCIYFFVMVALFHLCVVRLPFYEKQLEKVFRFVPNLLASPGCFERRCQSGFPEAASSRHACIRLPHSMTVLISVENMFRSRPSRINHSCKNGLTKQKCIPSRFVVNPWSESI